MSEPALEADVVSEEDGRPFGRLTHQRLLPNDWRLAIDEVVGKKDGLLSHALLAHVGDNFLVLLRPPLGEQHFMFELMVFRSDAAELQADIPLGIEDAEGVRDTDNCELGDWDQDGFHGRVFLPPYNSYDESVGGWGAEGF